MAALPNVRFGEPRMLVERVANGFVVYSAADGEKVISVFREKREMLVWMENNWDDAPAP